MPDPQGNLVTPVGIDPLGALYALLVDDDGRLQVSAGDAEAHEPEIFNVTMAVAGTEYSQALPAGTKKFTVKCRTYIPVQICFTTGGTNTLFLTIPPGQSYWEDRLLDAALTLYFECAVAAQVIEIVAWS